MRTEWTIFLMGVMIVKGDTIPAISIQQEHGAVTNNNITSNLLYKHSKGNISFMDLLKYKKVTIPDTDTICTHFRTVPDLSETCGEQLEVVCGNSTLLMTMLDASGKFPYPGLEYSSRMAYGNFDQCLTIDHTYSDGRILGEYCAVGLTIPDILGDVSDVDSSFQLALCRPDACVAQDYNAILGNLTSHTLGVFMDLACVTVGTNSVLNGGDIATVSIFLVVITLMALSTLYDICLYYKESAPRHPSLLSFSVLTNGRKLLHITRHSKSKEHIESFHGLRTISMMWIVAGHGMAIWSLMPVTNEEKIETWPQEMYSFYLISGPLAVDTFFFMSGFLLAFLYFKENAKTLKEQVTAIPSIYLHRYLRIMPALLMLYLVTITVLVRVRPGPLWMYMAEGDRDLCKAQWWKFFLFIQNYSNEEDICLNHTWYVSVDMQLFLLSPLLLIPLSLHLKKYGFKVVMVELLVWNIFWTFIPVSTKLIMEDEMLHYFDTHTRVINYSIGITLGLFMRVKIEEPFLYMINNRRRHIINLITWPMVILGMLTILLCCHDGGIQERNKSQFDALMRSLYCIGLSWITYSCYHGQGGFVNWILCRPIFQVLGKLTYCMYLIHNTVISYFAGRTRTKWYFSDYDLFYQFCGHYMVSLVVATFWTLAFEAPIMILEKYLLSRGRKFKEIDNTGSERNERLSKDAA